MGRKSILIGALFGGLTAVVVDALSYLANQAAGLPRLSFALFDWMARILPGGLLTLFIDTMVMIITRLNLGPTSVVAKQIEQAMAVLLFVALGALFGVVLAILGRRNPGRLHAYGMAGGLILSIPMALILRSLGFQGAGTLINTAWLPLIFVLWGWVLGKLIQVTALVQAAPVDPSDRRRFLYLVGVGSFTILASAVGVSLVTREEEIPVTGGEADALKMANAETTSGPAESPPESELSARIRSVPGTRPELTSNADFYRIDINTVPPTVDGDSWRLDVGGLVTNPLQLSLDEIRLRPAVSQAITLECISNRLAGDLISTSVWTGVRLKDILAEAGLHDGAKEVFIEAADGFYESVPLAEAMDERTLLVYEMNGEPLPVEHGFPLRIYIPDHFGMKQPKWITRMEVIDHAGAGYWVERGWSKEAIPPVTSVIDTVVVDELDPQTGAVPVGGIAYAGARGISRVEVRVDDGPWVEAELRSPPLSPLTWVQWRYEWQAQPGQHTFQVRAYDGRGEPQIVQPAEPHPNGATGIHSVTQAVSER